MRIVADKTGRIRGEKHNKTKRQKTSNQSSENSLKWNVAKFRLRQSEKIKVPRVMDKDRKHDYNSLGANRDFLQ